MKILYLHGFGSAFSTTNPKVAALQSIGEVFGVNLHYRRTYAEVYNTAEKAAFQHQVDLIVGTSMGGNIAAQLGQSIGIPFVSINPSIDPAKSLDTLVPKGVPSSVYTDHTGSTYPLVRAKIATYKPFLHVEGSCGLILLDSADTVCDPTATKDRFTGKYEIHEFDGGSHQFEHITESLPIINTFYETSQAVYGNG
jgi:hypothetical protein